MHDYIGCQCAVEKEERCAKNWWQRILDVVTGAVMNSEGVSHSGTGCGAGAGRELCKWEERRETKQAVASYGISSLALDI